MAYLKEIKLTVNETPVRVHRTTNDVNGNPRYIVSWLTLGLDSYEHTPETRRNGMRKYSGKAYGGGFVFSTYNLQDTLSNFIK